jgi:hypothetical protein
MLGNRQLLGGFFAIAFAMGYIVGRYSILSPKGPPSVPSPRRDGPAPWDLVGGQGYRPTASACSHPFERPCKTEEITGRFCCSTWT